jgi:isopenicillin-N N-acyltransferase-like protein
MSALEFPFIVASGSPFEMGRQHGAAAREIIHRFLAFNLRGAGVPARRSRAEVLERVRFFEPLFREHCPALLEEVRGLAEGAGLSYEEALLLQIRGEVNAVPEGGCTAFAISGRGTATGQVLIGQNSDVDAEMETFGIVLHLKPDSGAEILMWTFAGLLGYHGVNGHGVAHFANSLAGGPRWRRGLPHYPLKRLFYAGRTISGCLELLDRYPVCSSGNYVLAGAGGEILDVELTPEGYGTLDDGGEGFIVHANHFLSPRFATPETDAASLPDSCNRQRRLREQITAEFGDLSVPHLQRFLADHDGYPGSICRHLHESDTVGKTAASLIAEPEAGRLHVCRGNPCEGTWRTYTLARSGGAATV